jgi:hypothetical protein
MHEMMLLSAVVDVLLKFDDVLPSYLDDSPAAQAVECFETMIRTTAAANT